MPRGLQAELKLPGPLPSPATEAFLAILRTAAVLDHQIEETLRPYGVRLTQYAALRILDRLGPHLCGREIGERMVARVPDMPRLLKRMEAMGLISRRQDPGDRRHRATRLTPKGRRLVKSVGRKLEAILRSRLSHLSARTVAGLIDGLAAVRNGS
jgi:DNA-binding MarR family transcriptional regulator